MLHLQQMGVHLSAEAAWLSISQMQKLVLPVQSFAYHRSVDIVMNVTVRYKFFIETFLNDFLKCKSIPD